MGVLTSTKEEANSDAFPVAGAGGRATTGPGPLLPHFHPPSWASCGLFTLWSCVCGPQSAVSAGEPAGREDAHAALRVTSPESAPCQPLQIATSPHGGARFLQMAEGSDTWADDTQARSGLAALGAHRLRGR